VFPWRVADVPMDWERSENRCRVLVVDDRRDAALILKTLLERAGYDVFSAEAGDEGIELARQIQPHAIISDLSLPGSVDGYALARAVRAGQSKHRPLLIAVTGFGEDEKREAAFAAGFDHYLVKPPMIPELLGLLDSIKDTC